VQFRDEQRPVFNMNFRLVLLSDYALAYVRQKASRSFYFRVTRAEGKARAGPCAFHFYDALAASELGKVTFEHAARMETS